ncbi:MAG TPA: imidazole glycerol phosphate synthase subunit HisH, partial [Oligoflexia bacterium]|nr:imidazole glycerol phosphate synthase subunit HisH [Oligoflexia bacterium]
MSGDTVIIDYGVGNLGSIQNMLQRVGVRSLVSSNSEEIHGAQRLIFPGVGAFDHGIKNLRARGLEPVLKEAVLSKRIPILGICVGMQLLANGSDEGAEAGLGWIPGRVVKFSKVDPNMKIPHMGWNRVEPKSDLCLFRGLDSPEFEDPRFYFVHSYYFRCERPNDILGTTEYYVPFVSAIRHENIWGVQFHPEKSHKFGMKLFRNFIEVTG